MKRTLLFSTAALFLSIGANAEILTWTGTTPGDLGPGAGNGQLTCTGLDCHYTSALGTITDNLLISNVGEVANPLVLTIDELALDGLTPNSIQSTIGSPIQIDGTNYLSLINQAGFDTSGGPVFYFNSGSITGDFTNASTGLIESTTHAGVYLNIGSIGGNFTNAGTINIIGSYGVALRTGSNIAGNFSNSGSITSDFKGVHLNASSITGTFTNTGTIAGDSYGVELDGSTLGAFMNDTGGVINSFSGSSVQLSGTTTGAFTNNGTIENTGPNGNTVVVIGSGSNITGGFTNTGIINTNTGQAGTKGIDFSGSSITGGITNTGSIDAHGHAIYGDGATITGDIYNNGYLGGSISPIYLINSTVNGSFINGVSGEIDPFTDGMTVDNTLIDGNFENHGVLGKSVYWDHDAIIMQNGTQITGNFINTGNINDPAVRGSATASGGLEVLSGSSIDGDLINSGYLGTMKMHTGNVSGSLTNTGTMSLYMVNSTIGVDLNFGGIAGGNGINESNGSGGFYAYGTGFKSNNATIGGNFNLDTAVDLFDADGTLTIGGYFSNTGNSLATGFSVQDLDIALGFTNTGEMGGLSSSNGTTATYVDIGGNVHNADGAQIGGFGGGYAHLDIVGDFINDGTFGNLTAGYSKWEGFIDGSNVYSYHGSFTLGGDFHNTSTGVLGTVSTQATNITGNVLNEGAIDSLTISGQGTTLGNIQGEVRNSGIVTNNFNVATSIGLGAINEAGANIGGHFYAGASLYGAPSSTIGGSVLNNGTVGGNFYVYGNVSGNVENNGTVYDYAKVSGGTITGNVINNGTIGHTDGENADGQIWVDSNVTGDIINNGTIYGRYNVLGVSSGVTNIGNIINSETGALILENSSTGGGDAAIQIQGIDNNITTNIINQGTITSDNEGIVLYDWDGMYAVDGSITNSGSITAAHRGIQVYGFELTGSIVNSGSILATDDFVGSSPNGNHQTYGIYIQEGKITDIQNTATGTIQGEYGIGLTPEHAKGNMSGRLDADKDLTIVNDGSIVGSKYAAIILDYGNFYNTDETVAGRDNILNYSGTGSLSGFTHDIEMAEGNDTINFTATSLSDLSVSSVENINLSADTTVSGTGLTVSNSATTAIANSGSISGITADTTDTVLNYTGAGTLSGAIYDIDMADGNDAVNFTTTNLSDLSVNSAESISLSADSSVTGSGLTVSNSATTAIANSGSLSGITADATDTVLNYTGTGTLSGATYDIDMAAGNDTVNLTTTNLSDLSVNSVETISLSADANVAGSGLTVSNSATTSIANSGSISGIITDGTDTVLNYTGAGSLAGAIDMAAGNDALNFTTTNLSDLSVNSVENISLSADANITGSGITVNNAATTSIANSGSISGIITDGTDTVLNYTGTGSLAGAIDMAAGNDTLNFTTTNLSDLSVNSVENINLSADTNITGSGLTVNNTATTSIANSGSLSGITADAASTVLNYTGAGSLSGVIDMAAGNDTINFTTTNLSDLSLNSVESINISADTNVAGSGLTVNNSAITSIANSGSLAGITADATNTVLNYTGAGTLSGATYDIDMAAGNDTINFTATNLSSLSVNSVEDINLSADTSITGSGLTVNNSATTYITNSGSLAGLTGDATDTVLNYTGTGTLSGATYDIDMAGGNDTVSFTTANLSDLSVNNVENINLSADTNITGSGLSVSNAGTTAIINSGFIAGITGDATDTVLNYTGSGSLVGAGTYDVDMGTGNDTLNITNVMMDAPSINGSETVDITASTLNLVITDLNKGNQLITTNGTTSLSLANLVFDFNSDLAILTEGTDLLLMESNVITTDLATLNATLLGSAIQGEFSLVNTGGMDQLHFLLPAAIIEPVIPVASAGAITSGTAGAVAAQVSSATDNAIAGRNNEVNAIKKIEKERKQFASLYSDFSNYYYQPTNNNAWAQAFGLSGRYDGDASQSLIGFDTNLAGATMGYDYDFGLVRAGGAITFASGNIAGDENAFDVDVQAFSASLYSVFDLDTIYIESAISFGSTTFDQTIAGLTENFASSNTGVLLRTGMRFHVGSFGLEPFVGLQYKNNVVDQHETGTGTVDEYNQEMIRADIGMTTSYQHMLASGNAIVPYLRIEGGYDFADVATLSSIDNAGLVIDSAQSVDFGNMMIRSAVGASFLSRERYSIGMEYEYEFRDSYQAHIGKINGRIKF